MDNRRADVCLVVTSMLIVRFFLIPHIMALSKRYSVTLIANVEDRGFLEAMALPVRVVSVPIRREVSIWWDIVTLFRLIVLFRRYRFRMIHTVAPKAGLLGILAAWLAGVPIRVHTFQGEVWATRRGLWRAVLRSVDRLVARLATNLTVVSYSERTFLIDEGVISGEKSVVLAEGSICGVDPDRFCPAPDTREEVRRELEIPDEAVVILFLGRVNRDKGVLDLAHAFVALSVEAPESLLLVVGPDEGNISGEIERICGECADRVRRVGYTEAPERYMAAADVLCLPSYREGFGLVIIESAAVGLPSVCSRIYGITDAVDNGKTGLLFAPGNMKELEHALGRLVKDEALRQQMGRLARERALERFSKDKVVQAMLRFYAELLPVEPTAR